MKTVFIDVDTQLDFLLPSGALYVPGAERRIAAISKLMRYGAENGIPIVSTMDAHAGNDPEFRVWPPHCVKGALGQRKPEATLLPGAIAWPLAAKSLDVRKAPQILLEKITTDCFECPNLIPLLDRLDADRYVVYGVATDVCVRNALRGFVKTGKPVELVTDAIQELDPRAAERVIHEFQAAGGGISTAFA